MRIRRADLFNHRGELGAASFAADLDGAEPRCPDCVAFDSPLRQRIRRNRGFSGFTDRSGSTDSRFQSGDGPGALQRLRVVGDAREPAAQLDGGRMFAALLKCGADRSARHTGRLLTCGAGYLTTASLRPARSPRSRSDRCRTASSETAVRSAACRRAQTARAHRGRRPPDGGGTSSRTPAHALAGAQRGARCRQAISLRAASLINPVARSSAQAGCRRPRCRRSVPPCLRGRRSRHGA